MEGCGGGVAALVTGPGNVAARAVPVAAGRGSAAVWREKCSVARKRCKA